MKLAVFHNLPSGGALKSLAQRIVLLRQRGHQVLVYTFGTSDLNFGMNEPFLKDVDIQPLQFQGMGKFRRYFRASREVADRINSSNADRVLVDKCRYFGSPPILRILKKRTLFYAHEPLRYREYEILAESSASVACPAYGLPLKLKVKKLFRLYDHYRILKEDKKSIRRADLVMTNSHYTKRWLAKAYGVEAEVNYQGVDAGFFSPAASENKRSSVLSVGRLNAVKGYPLILAALAAIEPASRPVWDIVCDEIDPVFEKWFRSEAERCGVSYCIRSRISEEELRALYRRSGLVLCASHREPLGLVPLEAMSCGVPVLALCEGGFLETVKDGETGFLLGGEPELWAEKIVKCLGDAILWRRLSRNARGWIESCWNWTPFIERLEQTLENLAGPPIAAKDTKDGCEKEIVN